MRVGLFEQLCGLPLRGLDGVGSGEEAHRRFFQLELNYEAMPLSPDSPLLFLAYMAGPATPSHDNLQLLLAPEPRSAAGRTIRGKAPGTGAL